MPGLADANPFTGANTFLKNGDCVRWGHPNPLYYVQLGANAGGGQPFLAAFARAGTNNNTYRSDAGGFSNNFVVRFEAGGNVDVGALTGAAGTDNQSATDWLRFHGADRDLRRLARPAGVDALSLGYMGLPIGNGGAGLSGNYTPVIGDVGCRLQSGTGSALTITLPTHASVPYPGGTIIALQNFYGGGAFTIAPPAGGTLTWLGTGLTGNRTLATGNLCFVYKIGDSANDWAIYGPGGLS